jgi:hypothetical protein
VGEQALQSIHGGSGPRSVHRSAPKPKGNLGAVSDLKARRQ